MHLHELLAHYGLIAVFVVGLFEGETILILGAYAVHQGYLSMLPLIACGALAAFCADQFYFHLGRRKGGDLLATRPKMKQHFNRIEGFIGRHPVATVFLMRFAWGFRIVMPAALGMGRMSATVYALLDAAAALVWAAIVALFGVELTGLIHGLVGRLRPHEHQIVFGAIALALVVAIARQWRMRR